MNYLICLFLTLTFLLPTSAQSPVPIEKEPRHRLKFSNQHVRVFNVLIPAGDTSLFHIHVNDGLSVAVSEGRIVIEVPGKKLRTVKFKLGDSQWYEGGTKHTLRNVGSAPFEAVEIELK